MFCVLPYDTKSGKSPYLQIYDRGQTTGERIRRERACIDTVEMYVAIVRPGVQLCKIIVIRGVPLMMRFALLMCFLCPCGS